MNGTSSPLPHAIRITSVGNARELGGFPADGRTVRHGLLLRTASLAALSPEDRDALERVCRVAAVVDLRMSLERDQAPDPAIPGAENVFLPVLEAEDFPGFTPETAKIITDPNADRMALMKNAYEMGMLSDRLYVDFLFSERGRTAYRALFRRLLELPEGRAVLWHCTDGKDRTGVASMLILTALGASRETVLEDYLLTNVYNGEKLAAVRAKMKRIPLTRELRELAVFGAGAAVERYMRNALSAMDERCGSPEAYLADVLGVGAAERSELRRKFTQ